MQNRPAHDARRCLQRRAFSLLELVAVVAILGLLAGMAATRLGGSGAKVMEGEGFAHRLARSMRYARSASISSGHDHYVHLARNGGQVTGFTIYRESGSGDVQIEQLTTVPTGITVAAGSDRWEFGYDGAVVGATGAGTISVTAPTYLWSVSVAHATGSARVTATPQP